MTARRDIRQTVRRILPVLGLFAGLAILLAYPASELLDSYKRAQIAASIDSEAAAVDTSRKDEILAQAHAYNRHLAGLPTEIAAESIWPYERQLTPDGHNVAFGYVVIPKIALTMPVYHGTSDAVLSAGVGHLDDTSLPVGGSDTHAVLSAHSGLNGARAFDDIRNLDPGDVFGIKVLGELYCYRVTDSVVLLPEDIRPDAVAIHPGEDLCTLITCTPYGVNSHRLLVNGVRCAVPDDFYDQGPSVGDVVTNRRVLPAVIGLAVAVAVLLLIGVMRRRARTKKSRAGDGGPMT